MDMGSVFQFQGARLGTAWNRRRCRSPKGLADRAEIYKNGVSR